ncbi:hypothetical protein COV49_00945 [Candidatus Falkowbacteria bacterium CG11_big_fil_rev_8_21_14_0_20_39_10]|uniref:Dipeptidylpeptidase IV N-terminal domain-containing protein n=1 Tax=Candidatus Falkowbacteria bacterium CG11_big_fil_rev_8_21_14_0_20_39_10 TaxID=1974570 RepID=A0A2M6K9U1_9BACT|nr:MAG: hypothetical protein COV49_00945 [Candidatus Falkowbacteria bacterium CG11_big_fil_rev_8_21_14_0_20_39_10]
MDFFFRHKRIFLIIGFVLIVLILGYLLYAIFFKPAPPETVPTETGPATSGQLPTAGTGSGQVVTPEEKSDLPADSAGLPQASAKAQGGLTQTATVSDLPSAGATLDANGSGLQYYNRQDGKFYRVTKSGQVTALSDKIFHNVETVTWSPNKNKAILEYPDGANIVYDFTADKQATLPKHWKDFDFSPDGDKIVMKSMGLDPDNRYLAISNDDGSKSVAIESLGDKDSTVYPSWSPNNQTIAMYTEGVDFDRQEVFFVGLNNENFKSTVIEGRGFEYQWAPKGEALLYSVYSSSNDLKPMLWSVNAHGDSIGSGRTSLNLETWAHKCTYASETELYCAVPEKLEQGAGLFPELAKDTTDDLYKVDTKTGLKKLIAIPDGDYTMSNLIVTNNGSDLYFTDETTQAIHKIKLK